jgi:hypothetical protein
VADSCENGHETHGSIKGGKFIDRMSTIKFSIVTTLLHGVSYRADYTGGLRRLTLLGYSKQWNFVLESHTFQTP